MSGTFLLSVLTLFAASSVVLSGLVLLALRLFGKRIRHAVCCLILTACALRILIPTGFFFPALIPFSLSRETFRPTPTRPFRLKQSKRSKRETM